MPDDHSEIETALLGNVSGNVSGRTAPSAGSPGLKPGFEPGTRVGDYEILNAIGAGGMGEVYRVRNVISDRIEAMKVLLPTLSQHPELAERFTREIKVQATMQHPNIAGLHTAFHFNSQLVMIIEYLDGVSLDEKLRQGPIPLADCLAYVIQVLRALSYAHARGVTHRDIKPSNIMVMPDGAVKLMDFGIANVANDPKLTGTGVTVGSPYYMSPEQIRGELPDPRSDIYSLGIMLYEMVTGRRPINGDSQFSIMSAHLNDVPTPPIALDHTLPAGLNEIILMSIAKQAERRFQTADAFLNALESVRGSLGNAAAPVTVSPMKTAPQVIATPPNPPPRAMQVVSQPKSHRGLYMALGATAAVVVLAVAGLEGPKWFRTSARDQVAAPVATPKPVTPQAVPPTPTTVISEPAAVTPAVPPTAAPAIPSRLDAPMQEHRPKEVQRSIPQTERPVRDAAPVPQAPAAAAPMPAAPTVSAAELQKIEDRLAHLSSRMSSLDHSLQRMEQSQSASGLGMRSDFIQSRDMMHSFAGQAEAALRNQDIPAATRYLDRAEIQVDKLAKALNQ